MGIRYKHDTGNTGTTIQVIGTLQESALPYLLYGLRIPYSPIAASLIQDQCHAPSNSCHHPAVQNSPTRSSMNTAKISLLCLQPSHLSRKCSSSSTSSTVHCLQDLSSLFRPLHLPVSILRATVRPLSFAKIFCCQSIDWHVTSEACDTSAYQGFVCECVSSLCCERPSAMC